MSKDGIVLSYVEWPERRSSLRPGLTLKPGVKLEILGFACYLLVILSTNLPTSEFPAGGYGYLVLKPWDDFMK